MMRDLLLMALALLAVGLLLAMSAHAASDRRLKPSPLGADHRAPATAARPQAGSVVAGIGDARMPAQRGSAASTAVPPATTVRPVATFEMPKRQTATLVTRGRGRQAAGEPS